MIDPLPLLPHDDAPDVVQDAGDGFARDGAEAVASHGGRVGASRLPRHDRSWCACHPRPQIRHDEIHATLAETGIAGGYDTPEKRRAHPHLARFVAPVARRPAGLHARGRPSARRRRR